MLMGKVRAWDKTKWRLERAMWPNQRGSNVKWTMRYEQTLTGQAIRDTRTKKARCRISDYDAQDCKKSKTVRRGYEVPSPKLSPPESPWFLVSKCTFSVCIRGQSGGGVKHAYRKPHHTYCNQLTHSQTHTLENSQNSLNISSVVGS